MTDNVYYNKGYQKGVEDTGDLKLTIFFSFLAGFVIIGLTFKYVAIPAANNFVRDLYETAVYVPVPCDECSCEGGMSKPEDAIPNLDGEVDLL